MRGKLIVIEGTDCSGKETQAKMLAKKLREMHIPAEHISFPNYSTPTGKIIGACYLGKKELCYGLIKGNGWFSEGANHVDSYVSSLYYAADRRYNIQTVMNLLDQGVNVILDRYTFSNMAHQGGKIESQEERFSFFKKIEILEFDILGLPKPDMVILLHVPYRISMELQKRRGEFLDQNEQDVSHLRLAEQTYLELKALYRFKMIDCTIEDRMRSIFSIHRELESKVMDLLRENS